jgi:glycosyltransferase involved in cell wall biosynthesis
MKFSLDSLVLRDNRVFAYGWVFNDVSEIRQMRLRVNLKDGGEVSLPVVHGKERPDVASAFPADPHARFSGWMVYAAWAGAGVKTMALVGCLENGRDFACPIRTSSDNPVGVGTTFLRTGLQRLGMWWAGHGWQSQSARETFSVGADVAPAASVAVSRIRRALERVRSEHCALVIDHDMGGGANQFRRKWIERQLATRPAVVVVTFEIATLRYGLEIVTAAGTERLVLTDDEPVSAIAAAGLVDEVLYNDAVSFPRPDEIPAWLLAFKRVPGTVLTFAVHDYFSVCPSQFLLNDSRRFCRVPQMKECLRCLPQNENEFSTLFTPRSMPQWRDRWGAALAVADEILCFSASSQDLLLRAYPGLDPTRIRIEPHAIEAFDRTPVVDLRAPLRIGVVGAIGMHKGAGVIRDLAAEIARRRLPVKIKVIGSLDIPCDPEVVETTGAFARADLPALIEQSRANVFILPSICPETFSYVTQELMALHVPLVSFDFGAPAERIANYSLGRVLPWISGAVLLEDLVRFHSDLIDAPCQAMP